MAPSHVVRITSKGQFTLPVEMRKDLSLGKDSYVYLTRLGRLIVIKKVDDMSMDDISPVLETLAKKSGVTRKVLMEDIEKARAKLLGRKHGRIRAHRSSYTDIPVSDRK